VRGSFASPSSFSHLFPLESAWGYQYSPWTAIYGKKSVKRSRLDHKRASEDSEVPIGIQSSLLAGLAKNPAG
jgi:hypothetical protein